MDTTTIRTFIALAQIKNFTKTAQQLFVAQSTVTNRIRDLESELGKLLFARTHKQIELTPAGIKFLEYAQRFITLENSALQELHLSPDYSQQIRIGTTNTIYDSHLQKRLCHFLKTNPTTALQITISHTQKMLQDLQDGLLDMVFSFSPLYKDGYSCHVYRSDSMVLVVAADNIEYAGGIYKDDLQKIKYLFCNFALQGVGLFIQDLFPHHHRFPFEIDNSTKLSQYIIAGLGYTFLPRSVIEDDLLQGKVRAIPLLDFAPPKVNSYYITREPSIIPEELEHYLIE
ncbi:MAG: LysR family transcriptional regulator [Megasphaera sp.]|jgi:LysR family transcriptional repressor of citA|uniref:LysR family transcriptional regulator n=1 Tax=Megasphaera sueciensis TaxID=349094 RepID=UPI003D018224|nr:LysR family transcriptional regulator [Megasphaera sp.]MCI1823583.1 LysR family transcriptional regulator [Megasphaera sp.]